MFPGVSRKETNLINLEAFERPRYLVEGNIHSIIDPKTGKNIASIDVSPEGSSPEQVRKNLQLARETYLKNSKYVGGNVYIKSFLSEWGKVGGYVDFRVAGTMIHGPVLRATGTAGPAGPLYMSGGLFPSPDMDTPVNRSLGTQGQELIAMQRRQIGRLADIEISPDFEKGHYDYHHGPNQSTRIVKSPYGFNNSIGDAGTAGAKRFHELLLGDQFIDSLPILGLPSFVSMHHTPEFRTPAEAAAFRAKLREGVFLQMITGTDALRRKDEVGMRNVSRYLANAVHVPRIRPEEEDETAF